MTTPNDISRLWARRQDPYSAPDALLIAGATLVVVATAPVGRTLFFIVGWLAGPVIHHSGRGRRGVRAERRDQDAGQRQRDRSSGCQGRNRTTSPYRPAIIPGCSLVVVAATFELCTGHSCRCIRRGHHCSAAVAATPARQRTSPEPSRQQSQRHLATSRVRRVAPLTPLVVLLIARSTLVVVPATPVGRTRLWILRWIHRLAVHHSRRCHRVHRAGRRSHSACHWQRHCSGCRQGRNCTTCDHRPITIPNRALAVVCSTLGDRADHPRRRVSCANQLHCRRNCDSERSNPQRTSRQVTPLIQPNLTNNFGRLLRCIAQLSRGLCR